MGRCGDLTEPNGIPWSGTIQITRSTYDLVGAEFDCESGGTIPVKGAGEVDVWRVVGRRADQ
jgi:guanylate cyclase